MYLLVLALAVLGAEASNQTECIRTAAQNITTNMTLVIRDDINRAFSGSNNFTGRTHDIISNATSLVVRNITDALQPLVNSTTISGVIVNSTKVVANITSQFPGWVGVLTRAGDQIGSNGGIFFAREIASSVSRAANGAIADMRRAFLNCLRYN